MKSPTPHEEEIFLNALEHGDPAERDAYLDTACGADAALRQAVEEMLTDHERAGTLFQQLGASITLTDAPAAAPDVIDRDAGVGKTIGPYTLTRLLGEGGGGVVYEAAQETPVRRKVALKILKLGMDTRQVIARFAAERQTLALMEHPNIARVIDAGATETGRPYFVMELVDGARITDFCETRHLPLEKRLRLMLEVCAAVQHAHQKGIIHRDLKPSNILICAPDGKPVPKVIDFGIAKATAADVDGAALITQHAQLVGTPAYMSPEQVQGAADIDTRSDVYSLGIILYELISGRPPFDNNDLLRAGIDTMRRRLLHEDPPPPSQAAPANSAGTIRDLDWIVLKALEKDRERRYATVRDLAEDIERFLTNEPVAAHPPSRWYRLQKLVHRNRLASAAIAVAALAMVGGSTVSTVLFLRARAAEHQQAKLRAEAEERARITKAAILLMQGKTAEADAEIRNIEDKLSQPSIEATNVFRSLAYWSASNGDWKSAAQRLLTLSRVNRFDDSDMTDNATRDLIPVAPTLLKAGQPEVYRDFCRTILARLGKTNNPIAAEHLLKICLQLPQDSKTMAALAPAAAVAEKSLAHLGGGPPDERLAAWRCAVLGLWYFRNAHYHDAVHWCDRALMLHDSEQARHAYCRLVRAMALWKLGEQNAARQSLQSVDSSIGDKPDHPFDHLDEGYWHDWLCVQALRNEARKFMESK